MTSVVYSNGFGLNRSHFISSDPDHSVCKLLFLKTHSASSVLGGTGILFLATIRSL